MTNTLTAENSDTPDTTFRSFQLAEPVADNEGAVVGNGVMSFIGGMEPQAKEDVRNSYQYASLAADHALREDPAADGETWYNMFARVMAELGWVFVKKNYQLNTSLSHSFSMETAALDVLKAAIAAAALPGPTALKLMEIAKGTVDVLRGNSEIAGLFDRQANKAKRVNFAVCASYQNEHGETFLSVGTTLFNAEAAITDVLFSVYESADVKIYQGEASMTLNVPVYDAARATVKAELGDLASTVVRRFPIR